MPKLHVIYDPKDQIAHGGTPEQNARFGFKVAILSLADDMDNMDIAKTATELSMLLLEQLKAE